MRKTVCTLFFTLFFACLLAGCAESPGLPVRCYVFEQSDEVLKPTVTLEENNRFSFMYSGLSSYLPRGTYEIDQNKLILRAEDAIGDSVIQYVFEINDDTLIFQAKQSTIIPSFASLPDGAVFK